VDSFNYIYLGLAKFLNNVAVTVWGLKINGKCVQEGKKRATEG
jgi:hypothetical protein